VAGVVALLSARQKNSTVYCKIRGRVTITTVVYCTAPASFVGYLCFGSTGHVQYSLRKENQGIFLPVVHQHSAAKLGAFRCDSEGSGYAPSASVRRCVIA
jgi:hypothetical protein